MDPQTTEQAVYQYNFISTIASLAALVASLAAVIRTFRRQPPLSEEVYKCFATKDDLHKLGSQVEKLREDIDKKMASGEKLFHDFERVIGQLEGIIKMCPLLCGSRPAHHLGGNSK